MEGLNLREMDGMQAYRQWPQLRNSRKYTRSKSCNHDQTNNDAHLDIIPQVGQVLLPKGTAKCRDTIGMIPMAEPEGQSGYSLCILRMKDVQSWP
jgi:hypothetical protein